MNEIISLWMDKINELLGIKQIANINKSKLLPFGSYKLGVSSPNGDIDCLVLSPVYVDR